MLQRPKSYFDNLKNNDMGLFCEIFEDNSYCVLEEEIKGKNVLDLGANIGYFSLFVDFFEPKKIIAVEPLLEAYIWLYHNTLHINNIEIIKRIVTDKDGDIQRIYNPKLPGHNNTTNSSIFYPSLGEIVETISLKTLLSKFTDDNDVVLKMDIEGSEYDVLMSTARDTMKIISTLYVEIHPTINPNYKGLEILREKLFSFGLEQLYVPPMIVWDGYDENGNKINEKPGTGYCQIEKWKRK